MERQYISKGGRITLIRSTLFCLPLLHVLFSSAKKGQVEVKADSEILFVGRRKSREIASSCKVVYILCR